MRHLTPQASRPRMTASFGLAQASGSGWNWDHRMTECDQALYAVKRDGGNRVAMQSESNTIV